MKKFINKLYEYYKTHSNIPEVSIDDSSGNPILDNVYAKAVCYELNDDRSDREHHIEECHWDADL
jgi:hypothetical protein